MQPYAVRRPPASALLAPLFPIALLCALALWPWFNFNTLAGGLPSNAPAKCTAPKVVPRVAVDAAGSVCLVAVSAEFRVDAGTGTQAGPRAGPISQSDARK